MMKIHLRSFTALALVCALCLTGCARADGAAGEAEEKEELVLWTYYETEKQ